MKRRKDGGQEASVDPHIDKEDHVLEIFILALGVVLCLQVRAEHSGNALPPEGLEAAFEHTDGFIARGASLAVDELDEDAPLPDGKVLELILVFLEKLLLLALEIQFALIVRLQDGEGLLSLLKTISALLTL